MMQEKTDLLKNRLLLKKTAIMVNEAIEENFGFCPNDDGFNSLLDERSRLSKTVRNLYDIATYSGGVEKLNTFTV